MSDPAVWDISKDLTNAKIPHLRVHKPKLRKWGTTLVIFAQVGRPPVYSTVTETFHINIRVVFKISNLQIIYLSIFFSPYRMMFAQEHQEMVHAIHRKCAHFILNHFPI